MSVLEGLSQEPELIHITSAFLDLLGTCPVPDLLGLEQWSNFDLCGYMHHQHLNLKILDRTKGGQMTGKLFYQMGTKLLGPNEKPRWWYYASAGVTRYEDISRLSTIIREYNEV